MLETILSIVVNIVILVGVLGLLIFLHELGHFIAAKKSNVRVDAFALGMGPKIWGFTRGETEYRLNAFPIGGYVSIFGEVIEEDGVSEKDKKDPRNFQGKHPLTKIFILIAGVTVNFFTAVIIYYGFLFASDFAFMYPQQVSGYEPIFGSITEEKVEDLQYTELSEGGNAGKNGWPESGYINAVGLSEDSLENIVSSEEFTDVVVSNKGEVVFVEICAEPGEDCEIFSSEISDEGKVGIFMAPNFIKLVVYEGWERAAAGFVHSINMLHLSGYYIANIFSDAQETGDYSTAVNTLSGPVGLYVVIDQIKALGILGILDLIANMSLVLFAMNLLPIPALDGGRIVLVLVEWATGDRYSKNIEAWLIKVSYVALMGLMVVILVKDFIYFDKLKELFS